MTNWILFLVIAKATEALSLEKTINILEVESKGTRANYVSITKSGRSFYFSFNSVILEGDVYEGQKMLTYFSYNQGGEILLHQ